MRPLLLALAVVCAPVQADIIGAHLHSKHGNDTYVSNDGHQVTHNNQNRGVYYMTDTGFTVGAYRNSYRSNTVYAGWTWHGPSYGRFTPAVTVTLATGYSQVHGMGKLAPQVMPSVQMFGFLRYAVAPAKGGVLQHISIEKNL